MDHTTIVIPPIVVIAALWLIRGIVTSVKAQLDKKN
jgi:hypothetical protein